jgi:redox-sensitive bicupin YhaK (pirin superfamily)
MSSHDSVHNDHRIEPGDLHWTLAGKGIVHTQQPEGDHARLDGLQLFVNLPRRLKRIEPATMLLRARDVPVIESPGITLARARRRTGGKTSPLRTPRTDPDRRRLPGRRHSHRAAAAVRLESVALLRLGNLIADNLAAPERASGANAVIERSRRGLG